MDRLSRRGLILGGLAAATLGGVALAGRSPATAAAWLAPGERAFTVDRGGLLRFDNGKSNVASPFPFGIRMRPEQLPLAIGGWRGADFELNLEAYLSVLPEVLINRWYDDPDGRQALFTALGSDSTRKLHRPDICYSAASWKISPMPAVPVRLGEGAIAPGRFVAWNPDLRDQRLVAYWYLWMDGRRRIEDGAFLMNVGSSLRGRTLAEAEATIADFVRLLLPRALPTPGLLGTTEVAL